MNYTEFAKKVQSKSLPDRPVYVFSGTEEFLKERALQLIKHLFPDSADEIKHFDRSNFSQQDFLTELCSVPFSRRRKLVVLKLTEKTELIEDVRQTLESYLKTSSKYALLIIYTEQWGISQRFSQLVEKSGVVVDCSSIPDYDLPRWVAHQTRAYGKSIFRQTAQQIINKTGNDLTLIDEALQKLTLFTEGRAVIESSDVATLVDDQQESEISELVKAISGQKPEIALAKLERLFIQGESLDKIIGYLGWYFRTKRPDATRIDQLLKTDIAIKTGLMDPELALRLAVVKLAG